jgi:tetratricopeptide (TPR) repeat protein
MSLSMMLVLALAAAPGEKPREAPSAHELEKRVAERPDDLALRQEVLEAYFLDRSPEGRKSRERHALWVVENAPDSWLAGSPFAGFVQALEPDAYERAKVLWLAHVGTRKASPAVLGNASDFFLLNDRDRALELLERAVKLAPDDPEWRRKLGHLHALEDSDREPKKEQARAALENFEAAAARTEHDSDRYLNLGDMANAALRAGETAKAEAYARELLDLAEASSRDWNYGNAVHDGHRILGQLALERGDVRSAKEHLLAAGETPGSPQLNSFGPELTLANDLLAAGERATVVEYLKACTRFWKTRGDDLRAWIAAIEAGQTPVLDRSFWNRPRGGNPQP